MTDTDVAQLTGGDVAFERFDRAIEVRGSLCGSLEGTRYARAPATLEPEELVKFAAHALGEVGVLHAPATECFDGQVAIEPHSSPML